MFDKLLAKRKKFKPIRDAQGFMKKHPEYLVMVNDPKDDLMIIGYGRYITTARITNKKGKSMGIVRKLLYAKYPGKFKRFIDQYLLFVDGALFKLSEALEGKGIIKAEDLNKFNDLENNGKEKNGGGNSGNPETNKEN